MGSPPAGIAKRSLSIAGHRTSVSLETPFWEALGRIARESGLSVQALVAAIDAGRGTSNLSSALRVHVLEAVTRGAGPSDGCRDGSAPPVPPEPPAPG